jgi:methylamine dehydrogenase heavy chain
MTGCRAGASRARAAGTVKGRVTVLSATVLTATVLTATVLTALAITTVALTRVAQADPLEVASVASLPPVGDHWVWIPDRLLQHSLLFDGDTGTVLGMIDSAASLTPKPPVLAGGHFYSSDIAYSRGLRGDRIDFVSIYDARSLAYVDEIPLPTMQGQSNASLAYVERIGDRFLGIFNQFPNVSVSIVDLEERRFVEEVAIAGCAGIYPVDAQHFATLCGNGSAALVRLDAEGHKTALSSSEPFFDAVEDPAFMSAGRDGSGWTFVTFAGYARNVDFDGGRAALGEKWSLTTDAERAKGWRPGGLQHVAVHAARDTLYVVMHRGKPGSHKQAGTEIWVFDLNEKQRIGRFDVPNLTAAFLVDMMRLDAESLLAGLLHWVVPSEGAHSIAVSRDDDPVLFVRSAQMGAVAVLDATTGETQRFLTEAGLAGPTLRVP